MGHKNSEIISNILYLTQLNNICKPIYHHVLDCRKNESELTLDSIERYLSQFGKYKTYRNKGNNGFIKNSQTWIKIIVDNNTEILIDLDFKKKLHIPSMSNQYLHALHVIPEIYIGIKHDFVKLLFLFSLLMKKSYNKAGLEFPPWRNWRSLLYFWGIEK